jgi:hypothetical protein
MKKGLSLLKVTVAFLFALVVSFNLLVNGAWANNFSHTCTKLRLVNNTTLSADCRMENGQTHFGAMIDLNRIIVNRDGNLGWENNGVFAHSCNNIRLFAEQVPESDRLGAVCKKINGMTVFSFINLDEQISNINGDLQFDLEHDEEHDEL